MCINNNQIVPVLLDASCYTLICMLSTLAAHVFMLLLVFDLDKLASMNKTFPASLPSVIKRPLWIQKDSS